ncbi:MAG TPA: triose-phosphate isomerase [Chitinophagales bacterium]|nr:triose-phosphate isomerase [Chitinophagales bacterium]
MRKKIVAANWKMNKTHQEALELFHHLSESNVVKNLSEGTEVIIAASAVYLSELCYLLSNPNLYISAQNCHQESSGAFTGEVSAVQLKSLGVTHVIVGHSERRAYYGDTDEIVLQKTQQVLSNSMTPIYCCGEPLNERESDTYIEYIEAQLENSIFKLSPQDFSQIVIAYEPIWAIGTGKTASAEQAQDAHFQIRKMIENQFGTNIAQSTSILYGGSCNATNAAELFSQADVDGGLIGGASLVAKEFEQIILSI